MRHPANTWEVEVETRQEGAIGKFSTETRTIRAEARDVSRFVIEDCHLDGLEPRFITSRRRLA